MLLTRRSFIARLGGLAAATAAVYGLPEFLRIRGWWNTAYAQEPDVVLDTFNGLAAMLWPGDDEYSIAQGESANRPGAIAANAGRHALVLLDAIVPQPDNPFPNDDTVPLSGAVASMLNSIALTVNPAALNGARLSPFARLAIAEKAEVYRVIEEETQRIAIQEANLTAGTLQYLFGILPAAMHLLAFSEVDVLDPQTRTLIRRPVGWDHAGYQGDWLEPVDGWDEFKGYYQNRREVSP
ncbi:MAG: hypothetical protein ACRESV_03440 [Nevskiales bacterium]